jgi:hypothetical protein
MKIESLIEPREGYVIAHWVIHDGWDWEDYAAASTALDDANEELGQPTYYTLIDLTQMVDQTVPPNTITRFPALSQDVQPNQAMMVITGARGFAYRIADIFARVFGRVKFATTLEEAYDLIEAHANSRAGSGAA